MKCKHANSIFSPSPNQNPVLADNHVSCINALYYNFILAAKPNPVQYPIVDKRDPVNHVY